MDRYELTKNYRAPKAYDGGHTDQKYYIFKKGIKVSGTEQNVKGLAPHLIVKAGEHEYVIPTTMVRKIGGTTMNANGNNQEPLTKEELPEGIARRVKSIQDGEFKKENHMKTKGAVNGILIGAAIGGGYAVFRGRSWITYALIGSVVGGFIGRMMSPTMQKVHKENNKDNEST